MIQQEMNKTDTPETDAAKRILPSMVAGTHYWVNATLCEKFERESREFRAALKMIKSNPGWQDNEVGFMSGHIAHGVLIQFPESDV